MISVVMPVRNAAATLPAALESLFAQTASDFEIVAVDDGSDDGGATRTVLEGYAARDARLLSLIALGTRGDARHLDKTLDRLSSHAHLDPPR